MPYLTIAGHTIYYEEQGDGPVVIGLHHATAALRNWRQQVDPLAAAGYRVFLYDRLGFGRSDPLPYWPLNYHQQSVDELFALCEIMGFERVALLGHSDGATISLMAAAQQPDRVAAVIAEAPHMWFEPEWLEAGFEDFRQTVMTQERFWRAMSQDHGSYGRQVVTRWRERWLDPIFRSWDVSAALADVICPTLVVHGVQDAFFPISHAQKIAWQVRRSEFWLIDAAGHTPHLEVTETFNTRIVAFLQEHYPSVPLVGPREEQAASVRTSAC